MKKICWQQLCNSKSVILDVTLFQIRFIEAVLVIYTVTITSGGAGLLVTGMYDYTLNYVLNIRALKPRIFLSLIKKTKVNFETKKVGLNYI